MTLKLANIPEALPFLDDVLSCTKVSLEKHLQNVTETIHEIAKAGLSLSSKKCTFAQTKIEWLGFNLDQAGASPIQSKYAPIEKITRPKTLRQMQSLMGSINQFTKFVPGLAAESAGLRHLLRKEDKFNWSKNKSMTQNWKQW